MSNPSLSLKDTAQRLGVRPDYIATLVQKKRLTPLPGQRFDASEVEKLAHLMEKLRHNGIATLVTIAGSGDGTLE